jgi:hypothetical protein
VPPLSVHTLRPSARYRIVRGFTDFCGNHFEPGEILTFRERHYLPYDGGNTVVFEEQRMYLQDDVNADVLHQMDRYLEEVIG